MMVMAILSDPCGGAEYTSDDYDTDVPPTPIMNLHTGYICP